MATSYGRCGHSHSAGSHPPWGHSMRGPSGAGSCDDGALPPTSRLWETPPHPHCGLSHGFRCPGLLTWAATELGLSSLPQFPHLPNEAMKVQVFPGLEAPPGVGSLPVHSQHPGDESPPKEPSWFPTAHPLCSSLTPCIPLLSTRASERARHMLKKARKEGSCFKVWAGWGGGSGRKKGRRSQLHWSWAHISFP